MVTPSQLNSWRPERLTQIADDVAGHRSILTRLSDDLDAGKPPASWTFADATAARTEHDRLTAALATQVAETLGVATALDAAAASIAAAQDELTGALRRASWNDLHVDLTTGSVRITRSYELTDEAEYAATVAREVADQIAGAVQAAQAADDALAAALTSASTTDVNTVGGMDEQRQILEYTELSQADQVAYLLEHPEAYALLDDYASDAVKDQVGAAIGAQLDAAAADPEGFLDAAKVDGYNELLAAFGNDPAVMASTYERLGPQGMLATFNNLTSMMYVGVYNEGLVELAGGLRTGLQSASLDGDFDGETFGRELVRYGTYDYTDDERAALYDKYGTEPTGNAAVLDYLMREGTYGDGLIRGVAWQLDELERTNPDGAAMWAHHDSFANPLNGLDGSGYMYQPDPMAAVMGQLGKHPELGLEFFTAGETGPERAEFYFSERDWSRDGFAGIAEAAFGIGTDPDNLTSSRADTGMFVSRFFDLLPENPEFNADNAAGAAEPVANLLKNYMPAVELAIDSTTDVPGDVRDSRNDYLPDLTDYPMLDKPDLDGLLKVALSTEDGMARIAEGVAGFRQEQLNSFAEQHPDGATTNTGVLQEIVNRSSTLEGYMQHAVGDIAIEGAISRDQQVAVFTGLVSEAVGLIPVPGADAVGDALGDVGKDVLTAAWNKAAELPSDTITQAFGSNEGATRDAESGEAMLGREKMVINTYLSLVQAGILDLPADLRDTWAPGGDLVSLTDMGPEDIPRFRADAWEELMGDSVSGSQINVSYKDPFNGWYDK